MYNKHNHVFQFLTRLTKECSFLQYGILVLRTGTNYETLSLGLHEPQSVLHTLTSQKSVGTSPMSSNGYWSRQYFNNWILVQHSASKFFVPLDKNIPQHFCNSRRAGWDFNMGISAIFTLSLQVRQTRCSIQSVPFPGHRERLDCGTRFSQVPNLLLLICNISTLPPMSFSTRGTPNRRT